MLVQKIMHYLSFKRKRYKFLKDSIFHHNNLFNPTVLNRKIKSWDMPTWAALLLLPHCGAAPGSTAAFN